MSDLPPFRLFGSPSPVPPASLREQEHSLGMALPGWLAQVALAWGWGKLADLFFIHPLACEPAPADLARLVKRWPTARRARWMVIGGDEDRQLDLVYGLAPGSAPLYAVLTRDDRGVVPICEGDDAFLSWISGGGIDAARLLPDLFGAPSPVPYAVPMPPNHDAALRKAFEDEAPGRMERRIETLLACTSCHHLVWEGIHTLLDPTLKVGEPRRKELMAFLMQRFRKNIAKTLAAQPAILAAVDAVRKTGRFLALPQTTLAVAPGAEIQVTWDDVPDFLHIRGTANPGQWLVRVTSVDTEGIERLNVYMHFEVLADRVFQAGLSMNLVRSVHVEVEALHADNEHVSREVDVYYHEDGTMTEDRTGTGPKHPSPLHRDGGPAALHGVPFYQPGGFEWWRHGRLHRDDGPAVSVPALGFGRDDAHRGHTSHYRDGLLHREDGPARRYANGEEEWWIHGERIVAPI